MKKLILGLLLMFSTLANTQTTLIFPNPTENGKINNDVDIQITELYFYDTNGKITTIKYEKGKPIDVSNLPNGIYWVMTDNPKIRGFKLNINN